MARAFTFSLADEIKVRRPSITKNNIKLIGRIRNIVGKENVAINMKNDVFVCFFFGGGGLLLGKTQKKIGDVIV